MIIITRVTDKHDRYCSSCSAHRKSNYDQLTFYRVEKATSKDSNTLVEYICNECAQELHSLLGTINGESI